METWEIDVAGTNSHAVGRRTGLLPIGVEGVREMGKVVVLLEDEPDLADLVIDLLEEVAYTVIWVQSVEALLAEAARHSPCLALVDGLSPTEFDLWWLGSKLETLGVPPVAFTAHASARDQFERENHDFVGVISKPFDADEFLSTVKGICVDGPRKVAS